MSFAVCLRALGSFEFLLALPTGHRASSCYCSLRPKLILFSILPRNSTERKRALRAQRPTLSYNKFRRRRTTSTSFTCKSTAKFCRKQLAKSSLLCWPFQLALCLPHILLNLYNLPVLLAAVVKFIKCKLAFAGRLLRARDLGLGRR